MTSAPAIGFEYRSSALLKAIQIGVAVLAIGAVALSGLPLHFKMALMGVVLVVQALCQGAVNREMPTAVGWAPEQGWTLRMSDGSDQMASLASSRVLGTWVLLRLRVADGGTRALWLLPDNSDADTRRRLRMRLAVLGAGDKPATD